jgi:pimeloyl-ACP methyl ester carboxylesterase
VKGTGVLGAVAASVAAGVAAGVALERVAVGRTRLRPDPEAREPFGELPGSERLVVAEDGVPLHVEVVGSGSPAVVFSHGFALSLASWHYQRRDLADAGRLVFFDHRGHGRSGRGDDDRNTIDQLGRDLGAVVDQVVPEGPVVLVGHSMGGMTVMALADQRPELFGDRVVGVVLVGTSAGNMAEALLRLPVRLTGLLSAAVLPRLHRLTGRNAGLIERSRRVGSDLAFLLTRRWGFGDDPSPAQVELVERMIASTPVDVITSFSTTFGDRDRYDALARLGRVPVLVVVGEKDRVTAQRHSHDIVTRLPGAELVVMSGAGHLVMAERAPIVNLHLRAFLRTVARGKRARRGA